MNGTFVTLALAFGGLVGSALRVWVTNDQVNFSKQSIADLVIGAAVGLLWPLYPLFDFPANANIVQQAAIVGLVAYFSSDLLTNVATRFKK